MHRFIEFRRSRQGRSKVKSVLTHYVDKTVTYVALIVARNAPRTLVKDIGQARVCSSARLS